MYFSGIVIFWLAIIYCQAAYYDFYDYCNLKCEQKHDIPHVVCERSDCGIDREKCNEYETVELTPKLKKIILDEHNKLRNRVANGNENLGTNGPQPPAANMMTLKYNDELGFIAQCWANTCQPRVHSGCHRTKNLPYVGQNIASRFSTGSNIYNAVESNVKRMIASWYKEVKLFNNKHINPYNFNKRIGHYTLMVWGNIQEIGCGVTKFKNGKWYTISLVCNYGSTRVAGNVIGGEMYKVGVPCSACPNRARCNAKYNGLCNYDTLDLTEERSRRYINRAHDNITIHENLYYNFIGKK